MGFVEGITNTHSITTNSKNCGSYGCIKIFRFRNRSTKRSVKTLALDSPANKRLAQQQYPQQKPRRHLQAIYPPESGPISRLSASASEVLCLLHRILRNQKASFIYFTQHIHGLSALGGVLLLFLKTHYMLVLCPCLYMVKVLPFQPNRPTKTKLMHGEESRSP